MLVLSTDRSAHPQRTMRRWGPACLFLKSSCREIATGTVFFTWNLSWVLILSLEFCPLSLADRGSDCLWHPACTVFWKSGVADREFITALSICLIGGPVWVTSQGMHASCCTQEKTHFICSTPCTLGAGKIILVLCPLHMLRLFPTQKCIHVKIVF